MSFAFRADEAAEKNFERAKRYLIDHEWSSEVRAKSEEYLRELTYRYGPVVDTYPTWHPFVRNHDPRLPEVWPSERTKINGLDHTVGFANAFVTCPYAASDNVKKLKDSIANFPQHHIASVSIEPIDVTLYSDKAQPMLVVCDWAGSTDLDGQIPKQFAVPMMIEQELASWEGANLAERWDTMRPYILGEPYGSRSSLFVSQETGVALKKAYMTMVESGMFGPLRMG